MKINKIMNRSGLVVTCLAGVILTGCATHPGGKTDPQAWITQCNLTAKEQQCLLTVKKKYDAMTTAQQHNVITWFKDHYKRQSMWKRAGKKSCPRMTQQNLSSIYRKVDQCVKIRKHDFLTSSDYGSAREQDATSIGRQQLLTWEHAAGTSHVGNATPPPQGPSGRPSGSPCGTLNVAGCGMATRWYASAKEQGGNPADRGQAARDAFGKWEKDRVERTKPVVTGGKKVVGEITRDDKGK